MSSSNAGPGGVRNLRAMFENKTGDQSTSPPSRGRSPNGSISSSQDKPLDKIKTSFVAVEEASGNKQVQDTPGKVSNVQMDGMGESERVNKQDLGHILKGSPFLENEEFERGATQHSQTNGLADKAAAMVKAMREGNTNPPPVGDFVEPVDAPRLPIKGPRRPQSRPSVNRSDSAADNSHSASQPHGPIVKPKGGVAKIQGVMDSAARAKEGRAATAAANEAKNQTTPKALDSASYSGDVKTGSKPAIADTKAKGAGTEASTGVDSAGKAKVARVTSSAGPKSETLKSSMPSKASRISLPRARLPSAATASTASSVAKTDEGKVMDPRPTDKKTTAIPARVASTTTAATLAKKTSRASLNTSEATKAKGTTRPADEGFLARMMRPTASSASKAHDKVQVSSPPRSKPSSIKPLATKASRRSLNQVDDEKENDSVVATLP